MKKQRKGLSCRYDENSGDYVLRLYATDILKRDSYCLTLNSGGFRTNHTKKCINENLPDGFRVYQEAFKWFVETPTSIKAFYDNMILEVE